MKRGEIRLMKVAKTTMHEQTVLKNLLKMYCYEWSHYNKLAVNTDGEFAFETHASDYWTKEGYHAYLIAVGKNWAGFVLFDNEGFIVHKNYDYSMAEFFVLYPYRCSGVGRYVATSIFDSFAGGWEIGCHPKNEASVHFWEKVISSYTAGSYEMIRSCPSYRYHDGTFGDVLSFKAR